LAAESVYYLRFVKIILSYILTLAFSTTAFFNAFVVGDYFLRFDYYVSVLCENKDLPALACHGTCHLKTELTKDPTSNKQLPPLAEFKIQAVDFFENYQTQFIPTENKKTPLPRLTEKIQSADFYLSIYHPPENCLC